MTPNMLGGGGKITYLHLIIHIIKQIQNGRYYKEVTPQSVPQKCSIALLNSENTLTQEAADMSEL